MTDLPVTRSPISGLPESPNRQECFGSVKSRVVNDLSLMDDPTVALFSWYGRATTTDGELSIALSSNECKLTMDGESRTQDRANLDEELAFI
jgi:hypothetical protein